MKKLFYYWNESPWFFTIRFIVLFTALYGGFQFFIGIAAPGGTLHNDFIEQYFNLVQYYTDVLIHFVIQVLHWKGITAYPVGASAIRTAGSGGVNVGFDCLGLGVISIWVAYVVAHKLSFLQKTLWVLIGVFILYLLNISRISLLVMAYEYQWNDWKKLGLDHHTLYNIVSYILMFVMAWLFVEKAVKNKVEAKTEAETKAEDEDKVEVETEIEEK
jgi:exosortase/archaeosortase family protein